MKEAVTNKLLVLARTLAAVLVAATVVGGARGASTADAPIVLRVTLGGTLAPTTSAARFADALAQPPIEYLKSLRLSRAAALLRRTDLPIKAVASRVGYSSRSSFTRAFIARYGVAPHEFRAAVTSSAAASLASAAPAPRA